MHKYVIRNIFSNKAMLLEILAVLALQLMITYQPFINSVFYTALILALDWLIVALVSSTVFFLIEFEKYLYKKGYTSED